MVVPFALAFMGLAAMMINALWAAHNFREKGDRIDQERMLRITITILGAGLFVSPFLMLASD
ncbi:MAG: hypothetical protein AVDCRST_MAG83-3821 [uncultured Arthrobacter sp.]|uniref:Uncharacterized protein n=1 Tax=uncultured Arthrobacter sp. TaxID=114050 RepID=A0A6J4JF14_9MICC|nr:hypothetical protein [uncultured Arthrobacter sp.]CAA9277466.1 MAG: hypothetical protein AVDCRST_MAG83-3821 [uncultured Arthrobacter sp.]